MAELNPWWKTQAEFREKKAVVKLYREDKSFLTAVHIPSVYWPLSGPYEVFSYENTCCIEDELKLVELFDSLEYKIGHCYHNTEQVAAAFRQAGKTIKTYCGWAFINDTVPIHHCWAVLTDECNHKAVLDLACDNHKMREWFWKKEQEDPGWLDQGDPKDNIVEWMISAFLWRTQKGFLRSGSRKSLCSIVRRIPAEPALPLLKLSCWIFRLISMPFMLIIRFIK